MRIDFDDQRLFEKGRAVVLTLGERKADSAIEEFRFQHGRWVLKLKGLESISEAETWIGAQVSIEKDDLPEPEEGSYFDFQLKGCAVYEDNRLIGHVTEVVDHGTTILLRVDSDGQEILVPFVLKFLKKIDVREQRIDVELPEGLLDVNRRRGPA